MEDLETKDEVYSSVISQIESIKEQMDDLDKYFNDLPNKQSQVDEELSDLLHYIENNDLTPKQSLKMIKLIKEKRLIRRGLCNDNEIKRVYNNNRNKLAIDSQRPFFSGHILVYGNDWFVIDRNYFYIYWPIWRNVQSNNLFDWRIGIRTFCGIRHANIEKRILCGRQWRTERPIGSPGRIAHVYFIRSIV